MCLIHPCGQKATDKYRWRWRDYNLAAANVGGSLPSLVMTVREGRAKSWFVQYSPDAHIPVLGLWHSRQLLIVVS